MLTEGRKTQAELKREADEVRYSELKETAQFGVYAVHNCDLIKSVRRAVVLVTKLKELFTEGDVYDQYYRSITSVAANFVEGYGRFSKPDRIRFTNMGRASAYEAAFWSSIMNKELEDVTIQICVQIDAALISLIDKSTYE